MCQFGCKNGETDYKLLNKRTRTIPAAKEETDEASAIEEKKTKML